MVKNQSEITIGRKTAGYALTMFRNGVKESELNGYLMNTKKDIDCELVVCLWHWLKKIYKDLPERTKTAWGGAGDGRKGFFNWLYQLKNMNNFREFAFKWLQEQEKEAAALANNSDYGEVDYSGFSDLADYSTARVKSEWESWILSGAGVPAAGDNGDISRGAGLSPDAPAPGVYNLDAPF